MNTADERAICPNCGAERTGRFCPTCGQSSATYLRATWEIVREALDEFVGFDSRFARTLKALLRPGRLTIEYRAGRRASYVSPVRLYILVSVVFFSTLSLVSRFDQRDPFNDTALDDHAIFSDTRKFHSDSDMDQMYAGLTRAQRDRLRSVMADKGIATDDVRHHLDELDAAHPPPERPATGLEATLTDRTLDLAADPRAAWQKVVNDLPIAMFLTLPIYAAFLKLLYRRRFYAEHLVFALHLHAFLFALGTLIVVLPDAAAGAAAGATWLSRAWTSFGGKLSNGLKVVGVVYYFFALHAVYAERWVRAILKFCAINAAHATVIGTSILVTSALALFVF